MKCCVLKIVESGVVLVNLLFWVSVNLIVL